jgi:signal transduction histidine kinase
MDLVNNMLDYAKAEAGMIKLSRETVALRELVNQCIAMVEPKAKAAAVNISAQVDADVRAIVADPLRLKQVLLNLLTNAVKFNEQGGFVRMQVRAAGDDVVVSVRDTGRGISEEQVEHLFDPYYQAAHGDQGIGTGLGLSIIKHLVQLHGGVITVDSVPDSGSVFTVRLPQGGPQESQEETTEMPGDLLLGGARAAESEAEQQQEVTV